MLNGNKLLPFPFIFFFLSFQIVKTSQTQRVKYTFDIQMEKILFFVKLNVSVLKKYKEDLHMNIHSNQEGEKVQ